MSAPSDRIESGSTLPVFLTVADVAALLQISPKSVSRWALQDSSMPALRRGRVLRFERQSLLDWLRAQTQGRRKSLHVSRN